MHERCYTLGFEGAKLERVAKVHPWRFWLGCGRWQECALEFNCVQVLLPFKVSGAFEGGHEVVEHFYIIISWGDGRLSDVFVLAVHRV